MLPHPVDRNHESMTRFRMKPWYTGATAGSDLEPFGCRETMSLKLIALQNFADEVVSHDQNGKELLQFYCTDLARLVDIQDFLTQM